MSQDYHISQDTLKKPTHKNSTLSFRFSFYFNEKDFYENIIKYLFHLQTNPHFILPYKIFTINKDDLFKYN